MVIACPNCQRKYQIDTTRIPPGGTTFTCWTCRASVPVGATNATPEQAVEQKREEPVQAPPPRPALPRRPEASAAKADMPDTARRFFESLAAERIHQRKQSGPLVPPPPQPTPPINPPLSPLGPDVASATLSTLNTSSTASRPAIPPLPPVDMSSVRSVPPAPKPVDAAPEPGFISPPPSGPLPPLHGRASGPLVRPSGSGPLVTRHSAPLPDEPIDVFGDEDAQTTASLTPKASAMDDILDLNLFPKAPASEPVMAEERRSIRREPQSAFTSPPATLVMSSLAPPPEVEPVPRKAPNGHSRDIGPGITMPIRPPAQSAVDGAESHQQEPETAVNETTPLPTVPEPPRVEVVEKEPPRIASRPRLVLPPQPPPAPPKAPANEPVVLDDAVTTRAETVPVAPAASVASNPVAHGEGVAVTPADVASRYAAQGVEAKRRRSDRSEFSFPVMPIVAVLTLIVCGFIVWNFVLRDRLVPAPPRPTPSAPQANAVTAPPVAATAPTSNALPPAPANTPAQESQTAQAQSPQPSEQPAESAKMPAEAGGYTLQIMSAKAESESQSAVNRISSGGAKAYLARADLGARGIWYRVRVGQFASRAEAQSAGSKLVSSGQISTFIIVPYEPAQ